MSSLISHAAAPLIIGIAGGTGSGKTTFARSVMSAIGSQRVLLLSHDSYYRDITHLALQERDRRNFDHPDALDTALLIEHLHLLKQNKGISVPIYDFSTHGRRAEVELVEPAKVIIIEGILIFHDPVLADLMDIRVFVDMSADIRILRRLQRDVSERGRSVDSVVKQYVDTVKPMHEEFVEPSKARAHLIVHGSHNEVAVELLATKIIERLMA